MELDSGGAEEIDGVRRLLRRSPSAQRSQFLESGQQLRLNADLDLAAGDVDGGLLRLDSRFG